MLGATSKRVRQACSVESVDLWERLPPELLRTIVEASTSPERCYIQLLSLSHAIRQSIRGILRELSFRSDLFTPTITADALAALVGPCKSLRKLKFPVPDGWSDIDEATRAHWVDETFGGHTQLAVLTKFPPLSEPVVERILSHLPGLAELTASGHLAMSTRLLAALARSCPDLQVLRCSVPENAPPDFAVLAPLSGTLHEFDIESFLSSDESLAAFVGSLSAVTSLQLFCHCPPSVLKPIAAHLTKLELYVSVRSETDLSGLGLCRLESLDLNLSSRLLHPLAPRANHRVLSRLLAANQATLHILSLTLRNLSAADAPFLMAVLRALPHLTRLDLTLTITDCTLSALLPPDLVGRLEHLDLNIDTEDDWVADPVRITSSRLQYLCLRIEPDPELPGALTLQCPRLRTMKVNAQLNLTVAAPMPDLEVAAFSGDQLAVDPAWLLAGSSPRLRVLAGVRLTRPDLLASLCASGSLVRLKDLYLDVTRFPNPLVLRLPGQLEQLLLDIDVDDRPDAAGGPLPLLPVDLQVEAPGLCYFALGTHAAVPLSVRLCLHNCPNTLPDELTHLRYLFVDGDHDAATLLFGLLTRQGARLRKVTYLCGADAKLRAVWSQLMEALSGLPRLTSLSLAIPTDLCEVLPHLPIACPKLRRLYLTRFPDAAKVVLACPLLERITGIRDQPRQVEFALPAPNLGPQGLGEDEVMDEEDDEA
ncbi:hypothetical protein PAPYR_489 [Paratrimastix pyriformis]|uniref:F-box domain-containing protein n=1 Tax=Paratrimastix pyriformis TaxID=342808 RepID=A0ABQ8UVD4_9EUKA|nr:hypothetical protein PAPYR_489 [Paratrimastix pyriformis]